jgi:hypothetical protein
MVSFFFHYFNKFLTLQQNFMSWIYINFMFEYDNYWPKHTLTWRKTEANFWFALDSLELIHG